FGSGYVTMSEWWRVGLITSLANVVIWLGVGGAWLYVLGYW
ncbi:MAG: anion permease, partial [Longispora sp.]|nr:anion permease [Longispora sp. (in: high G+C Gram-positive bacteria)]